MDEIQYAQTVAAEQEWQEEQDRIAESARQNMQAARIEKDRSDILRQIGFYGVFKEKK